MIINGSKLAQQIWEIKGFRNKILETQMLNCKKNLFKINSLAYCLDRNFKKPDQ